MLQLLYIGLFIINTTKKTGSNFITLRQYLTENYRKEQLLILTLAQHTLLLSVRQSISEIRIHELDVNIQNLLTCAYITVLTLHFSPYRR